MSRADFLMSVIDRHAYLGSKSELLDVGAGDLFFSEKIHGMTGVRIDAVDSAFDEEGPRNAAIQKIKYLDQVLHKRYDAICALDVLEHVENDHEFLNLLLVLLKPKSSLMITVPAFQFLFSQHDHNLRHFRRYRLSQVESLIDSPEKYEIRESFYFFHALFFARIFEKTLQLFSSKEKLATKEFKSINHWHFTEHHALTRSLGGFLGMDAFLCRLLGKMHIKIPGLSLCMVIRKL